MGTIIAAAALVLAIVLTNTAFGPHFYVLAAAIALLWTAAFTRPRAALFFSAVFVTGFSALMISPFHAPRAFMNPLRREARGGDEGAQATLGFYDGLAANAVPLEIVMILLIAAAGFLAARRAERGPFQFLFDASAGIGAFAVKAGKVASFLFLPMIVLIVYDVAQRQYLSIDPQFTNTALYETFTSTKLQEMQWHLHAILFLMCFGFAYVKDAHVRIELVRDHMKPRRRVWIELLGCLLFLLPYCFVVFTYGAEFARKSFDIGEVSSALTGLPFRFIIKSFLPIGFLTLALAGLSVALKCVVYLFGPDDLRQKSSYYAGTHHADIPEDVVRNAGK